MYFTNGFWSFVVGMGATILSASEEHSPLYPGTDKKFNTLQIKDDTFGIRNVSYWVTSNNDAVIDGDIIYGSLSYLLSKKYNGTSNNTVEPRAHSIVQGVASWPQATIIYRYDSNATERSTSRLVNRAIKRWQDVAPYLTFTRLANSNVPQNGILTITANDSDGCEANLGYDANAPHSMNLEPGECLLKATIHEFGHVLGLYHEHQRADREDTIRYQCQNLDPDCHNMPSRYTCCDVGRFPGNCCTSAFNFDRYQGVQFDSTGPYDTASIMQYRADAFAKPGTKTMVAAHAGVIVPERGPKVITALDAARVSKLYAPAETAF